jgi:hypothetical protein
VSVLELPDEQVISIVRQLTAARKRTVLLALAPDSQARPLFAVLYKRILHFEENSHAAILHHEEERRKTPCQWRKIFNPASCSSVFVVGICYLQFRRFGWGFAALCS